MSDLFDEQEWRTLSDLHAWRIFLRRCYDVPDIVSDAGATAHIAYRLTRVVAGEDHPAVTSPYPARFFEALAVAGQQGRLDGFLVELPAFTGAGLPLELAREVGCGVQEAELILKDAVVLMQKHLQSRKADRT